MNNFCVCTKQIIPKNLPMEGLTKSLSSVCLSVCLSVRQFGDFLRDCLIVFSDFWHDDRSLEYLKTDRARFSRKIHFCQIWVKKAKNALQIGSFWIFKKILSLYFLGKNLKWKLILLLIFQHQSHIW